MTKRGALKAAFPHTLPILAGYLFLGIAAGILMHDKGHPLWLTMLLSVVVYAGSLQILAAEIFAAAFHPLAAFGLALAVNARHLFYGLSMLRKFHGTGKKRLYLIFGLTDETYSLLCSTEPPVGVDAGWFRFFITLLNQSYWIVGNLIGGLVGEGLPFPSEGIDFAMTALFTVILTEKMLDKASRLPALLGAGATAVCLLVFGAENFLPPAMALILALLALFRHPLERGGERA